MSQFLIKSTMTEMLALSSAEIDDIQNGIYLGVQLLGYYLRGDIPDPIIYYLTDNSQTADGGSIINVGGVNLKHDFGNLINLKYYGGITGDVTVNLQKAIDKLINGGTIVIDNEVSISSTINISHDNIKIKGVGMKTSKINIMSNDVFIYYKSQISDLSTSKFFLEDISIINKVNIISEFPVENMGGVGVKCVDMHVSAWKNVYFENFREALILKESYLNTFTNILFERNWMGVVTELGSNGNVFYGGVVRNSSIDFTSLGCERNKFISTDFEPVSTTLLIGNNNTFDNCRFERFNLLHQEYNRTWMILGNENRIINCDFHYNFEDRPIGKMIDVQGSQNILEIKNLNLTSNSIYFGPTSKNNILNVYSKFKDFEVTGTIKNGNWLWLDFGTGNKIQLFDENGKIDIIGEYSISKLGKFNNFFSKNWVNDISINANSIVIEDSNIDGPLGINQDNLKVKKLTVTDSTYVNRIKGKSISINNNTLFSSSCWIYVPSIFQGESFYFGNLEGSGILLDLNTIVTDKWFFINQSSIIESTNDLWYLDINTNYNGDFIFIAYPSISINQNYSFDIETDASIWGVNEKYF